MHISIECTHCSKKFAGKESLQGRRIRCPSCQEVFRVPAAAAAQAAASPPTQPEAAPSSASAAQPAPEAEIDEWNLPADFEYKINTDEEDAKAHCPFCRHDMQPEDVLCMNCGFNRKTGEKIQTKTGDEAVFDDQKQTAGGLSFGGVSLPMPVVLGVGGAAALAALVLLIFAPLLLALLLTVGGMMAVTVGHFWVIIIAFQEDPLQGLLAWFVPFYWWIYVLTRFDSLTLPFGVTVAGIVLTFFGMGIACSSGGSDPEEVAAIVRTFSMARGLA